MKQQVFVVHGGEVFDDHDKYISFLRNTKVDLEMLSKKSWKSHLSENLGEDFEFFFLRMPNSMNAKYSEWKIWFEKYISFMQEEVILLGTSLGAVFLAKYLSENNFPKKIKATFLVAPPYDEDETEGSTLPEFAITATLSKLEEQAGELYFYFSKDDPVVAFTEMEKYQKELPRATFRIFEDRMHFNMEEFPEIVEDIKNL